MVVRVPIGRGKFDESLLNDRCKIYLGDDGISYADLTKLEGDNIIVDGGKSSVVLIIHRRRMGDNISPGGKDTMTNVKVIDFDGAEIIYETTENKDQAKYFLNTSGAYTINCSNGISVIVHPESVKRMEIYEGEELCQKIEHKRHGGRVLLGGPSSEENPLKPTIEQIIEGVFLHGKETPNFCNILPRGQYTITEAIQLIEEKINV